MAFEVPPLPYDYSALEPHIDEQTMRVHHDKHHQAYVDNANKALEGTEWADRSVEGILADIEIIPPDDQGLVQPDRLRSLLARYDGRALKIGAFTACSNVTGITTPYHALARVMHEAHGYCFVDFAASAPYVPWPQGT